MEGVKDRGLDPSPWIRNADIAGQGFALLVDRLAVSWRVMLFSWLHSTQSDICCAFISRIDNLSVISPFFVLLKGSRFSHFSPHISHSSVYNYLHRAFCVLNVDTPRGIHVMHLLRKRRNISPTSTEVISEWFAKHGVKCLTFDSILRL